MSAENVQTVQRIYAEFERGNFWLPDLFDPDIQVVWMDGIFAQGAESRGLQDLTRHLREFFDAWEQVTATAERIIEVGDQVLVISVWRGRGKTSAVHVEARQGYVWTIRGSKVARVVGYAEPAEALEAMGLRE